MIKAATYIAGRIKIRPARPSDKAVVLEFCKHTFGRWGDYMPHVWDKWVKTRRGLFFVATINDRAVGLGKITVHRPGELWLEGLRVDPKYRGYGIGRVIQDYTWKKAMSMKPRFVRYATGSYNKISQHLGCSKGMKIVACFDEFSAKPLKAESTVLVRARLGDLNQVFKLYTRDIHSVLWHGFYMEGWTAKTFDKTSSSHLIKQQRVYLYHGPKGLEGVLTVLLSQDGKWLNYCRAAANNLKSFKTVLREGRKLAYLMGAKRAEMHLPKNPWFRASVKGTGWKKAMPIWMVVLEWSKEQ